MTKDNFTTRFTVEKKPEEAFNAINNVRGWWSENIEGNTTTVNEVFLYHYRDIHICKINIEELIPNQKVVWHVLENYFSFTKDESEWKDTRIIFEIVVNGPKTEVIFTHQGLVPDYECYNVCNDAWTNFIKNSLYNLIATGSGKPNTKEDESFNISNIEKWKIK